MSSTVSRYALLHNSVDWMKRIGRMGALASFLGALALFLGVLALPILGQDPPAKSAAKKTQKKGAAPDSPLIFAGIKPTAEDGRVLNLDFEKGDLSDWMAEGDAFKGQPIEGDTIASRRGDMKSNHQGKYWIGTYEKANDLPTGILTSIPFKVTHPWASFLVAGGSSDLTVVQVLEVPSGKVLVQANGVESETLTRFGLDLTKQMGKQIRIKIIDRYNGPWGHINFDDFLFHESKPALPQRISPLAADSHQNAGLNPAEAAKAMSVPEGFNVTLFAGEPDVHQPIAMAIDDRGRLWIAEAFCYPRKRAAKDANDRIVIFEDTNNDGKFDKRSVFIEGLNLVSGFEIGHGGVWVGAAPELLFIPWDETRSKPAGPPRILLDGWGYQDTHETLNAFIWGPDGWLWGCHGIFTHSLVGKPGAPNQERTPLNAGIWRYHPTKHIFEVVSQGTSNPWGLDFNDYGEAFVEACVIPHAFHIIPGGRYLRQAGSHFNPYTFADINTIADHRHYLGNNPQGGNNRSDLAGGGHAHCGTMIYLGGAWPMEYRNGFFMANVHGRRINMDLLNEKGSGYIAGHGPDFLLANDAYARFINLQYGPDGNVFLIDWYDKQACHSQIIEAHDRSNGRIFKISHRASKPITVDLEKETDEALVNYQLHQNDWFVRHARRILAERGPNPKVHKLLREKILTQKEPTRRLRALWALHATEGLDQPTVNILLADANDHVRGWTVRLVGEAANSVQSKSGAATSEDMLAFPLLDKSPVVRRELASLAQRLPASQRWAILEALATHPEDGADFNLPLLGWYALEPLLDIDPERAVKIALSGPPIWGQFALRKLSLVANPKSLDAAVTAVAKATTRQAELLAEIRESMRGRKTIAPPNAWKALYPQLAKSNNPAIRDLALALATGWGDPRALEQLRLVLEDKTQSPTRRREAMSALVQAEPKGLARQLTAIVAEEKNPDPLLLQDAIKAMANIDGNTIPEALIGGYSRFNADQKRDTLATLASRPLWSKQLLRAVETKKIPSNDLGAELVRQIRNLGDPDLERQLAEIWGIVRDTPADRKKRIEEVRLLVNAKTAPMVDLAEGRHLFQKVCVSCHVLYGTGGKVGPELTGSNRANLDYLLENMLDPGAVIPKEYTVTVLALSNGRLITGIITQEVGERLTVVTANETLVIAKGDIESRRASDQSMMPDNLLQNLTQHEVRSLFGYLRHPGQTPILANLENLPLFFNGKDLTNWVGDPSLWSVKNEEIVGKSNGLKKNQFLVSQMDLKDFRLEFQVKLTPNSENSGVQIRSLLLPDGEMRGPQADIGKGWWGKLYEESGRGLLWPKSTEDVVKLEDWNHYVIEANGPTIRTWINGKPAVDLTDSKLARRGQIGIQIHSGGPMEVRYKDFKLTLIGAKPITKTP